MTLDLPYSQYDVKKHMKQVVLKGERPNGKRIKTSLKLRDTIIQGWNSDRHNRPSMSTICDVIQQEVVGRKQDVKKNKRRSTVANILRRSQLLNERSELSRVGEDESKNAMATTTKHLKMSRGLWETAASGDISPVRIVNL
jgi:hypothetical protein